MLVVVVVRAPDQAVMPATVVVVVALQPFIVIQIQACSRSLLLVVVVAADVLQQVTPVEPVEPVAVTLALLAVQQLVVALTMVVVVAPKVLAVQWDQVEQTRESQVHH